MPTAKEFTTASIVSDLKEVCGDRFEKISPRSRLTILATLTQFQLLRQTQKEMTFYHLLMREAINSVPVVCWLGQQELQARVLRCCRLDGNAIAQLIQLLAENL